jgi:addiction module RelB/DinJ family antitoxin
VPRIGNLALQSISNIKDFFGSLFSLSQLTRYTTGNILCSMNTVISVKIDKDVKASAQEVANSAGLTLSTLVNAYLRQVSATRRIELYSPEQMTPKLEKLIEEVEAELKGGKASKEFSSVEEFLADLKK